MYENNEMRTKTCKIESYKEVRPLVAATMGTLLSKKSGYNMRVVSAANVYNKD